jgi:uncharacterized protein GlcG (DUF336 family)
MALTSQASAFLLNAAKRICKDLNYPSICAAVVDAGANLVAFIKMDGAMPAAIDIAQRKARTAALFLVDSDELGNMLGNNDAALSLLGTNGGVVTLGGGVVLRDPSGQVIGGLGISGGSPDQDRQISQTVQREFLADMDGDNASNPHGELC